MLSLKPWSCCTRSDCDLIPTIAFSFSFSNNPRPWVRRPCKRGRQRFAGRRWPRHVGGCPTKGVSWVGHGRKHLGSVRQHSKSRGRWVLHNNPDNVLVFSRVNCRQMNTSKYGVPWVGVPWGGSRSFAMPSRVWAPMNGRSTMPWMQFWLRVWGQRCSWMVDRQPNSE